MEKQAIEKLIEKWIVEERQYRAQVREATLKGTPSYGMAGMADGIRQCRHDLQKAFGALSEK